MAAPHVTGVVALMQQANPNLTATEIATILTQSANPTGIVV
jgi:subtilisin family serine protease